MTDPKKYNPFFGLAFEEALQRLVQTDKGELAEALTRDLVAGVEQTRKRIEKAREDIARGARTRAKKDRFRL